MKEITGSELKNLLDDNTDYYANILNAYFQFRSTERMFGGKELMEEQKTTLQIQDELESMLPVPGVVIVRYMTELGFPLITAADGTLRWQMYRIIDGKF